MKKPKAARVPRNPIQQDGEMKKSRPLPSAACRTLTSRPMKVLLASSSSAQSGEDWRSSARPVRLGHPEGNFSSGEMWDTASLREQLLLTEGLFRMSSMLKGVSGLSELAGGGRWSSGLRLRSSSSTRHLESCVEVMAAERVTLGCGNLGESV